MKRFAVLMVGLWAAGAAQAVCYDLRDAKGELLSSTPAPPFSLAWPTEEPDAKAAKARGERIVIRQGACYAVRQEGNASPVAENRTLGAPIVPYASSIGSYGGVSSAYSGGGGSYSGGSYSGGKTIHTGPRGGRYYINKNGNKTYVKRR